MRTIRAGLHLALDGVAAEPEKWCFDYATDEVQQAIYGNFATTEALLLGRASYDTFAAFWPGQDGPVAAFMNNTPKYVVSTTLKKADWQNTEILSSLEQVAELKDGSGGPIGMSGSLTLIRSLLAEDLLDELDLIIYPLAVGSGERLFPAEGGRTKFTLATSEVFDNGVIHAVYRPGAR